MEINININSGSKYSNLEIASRYLPVRLMKTQFNKIGDCIAFLANNADDQYTRIIENQDSVLFVILYNQDLYDEIQNAILKMDFWEPNYTFQLLEGEVDGVLRKIYLDIRAYHAITEHNTEYFNRHRHIKTIELFSSYSKLYPYIVYAGGDFKSIFSSCPIFKSEAGFKIKDGAISANMDYEYIMPDNCYNKCILKGYNQFYDRYETDNMAGVEYLIYTQKGFEILRDYFYDTSHFANKTIFDTSITGAITIVDYFLEKTKSITLFFSTKPILAKRAENIDFIASTFDNHPIKTLHYQRTSVFALAAIHYILKKFQYQSSKGNYINYDLLGGWEDSMMNTNSPELSSNSVSLERSLKSKSLGAYISLLSDLRYEKEEFIKFENFIDEQFDLMTTEDKDICTFIFPKYKKFKK